MKKLFLLFVLFVSFQLFADSFVAMEDFPIIDSSVQDYTKYNQIVSVPNPKIKNILYPVFSFPAIVSKEDKTFSIILKSYSPITNVTVSLEKKIDKKNVVFLTLKPKNIEVVGTDIYKLTLTLPLNLPPFIFDIVVSQEGERHISFHSLYFINQANKLKFSIFADPQIEDVTSKWSSKMNFNAKKYPFESDSVVDYSMQEGIIKNAIGQMNIAGNDFVLSVGDVVFGIDYLREYNDMYSILQNLEIPFIGTPGNHDGYAKFLEEDDFTTQIEYDGLNFWKNYFGPLDYALKINGKIFIMLNTYSGTQERRASGKPMGIGSNSAPPVSNFGGFLEERQSNWVETLLSQGDVFAVSSHQTPIGLVENKNRYDKMQKYPDGKLTGAMTMEEWNFETSSYDSNINDNIKNETQTSNTGTKFSAFLANMDNPPIYFSGHTHYDRNYHFKPGDELIPNTGIRAKKDMNFVITTTAATSGEIFWGIREVRISTSNNGLETINMNYLCDSNDCQPNKTGKKQGFQSVPLGNLWVEYSWGNKQKSIYRGGDGKSESVAVKIENYLPTEEKIVLRFVLPALQTGFQFDSQDVNFTDVYLSEDKKTVLISAKTTIDAGTTKEDFFAKNFESKGTVKQFSIVKSTNNALVPEVSYDKIVEFGNPIIFKVTNADKYFHLVWEKSGKILQETSNLTFLPETYSETEMFTLKYIDKHGAFGEVSFSVKMKKPEVQDEDSLEEVNEIVNDADYKNDEEIITDNDEPQKISKNSGCSCSLMF